MATTNPTARAAHRRAQLWLAWLRMLRHGIALGVLLVLAFTFSSSHAQSSGAAPAPCANGEAGCLLSGDFSAVSVLDPAAPITNPWITSPTALSFGALVYTDYVLLEETARAKLTCGLQVREAISPYRGEQTFEDFIQTMGADADLARTYPGPSCYGTGLQFLDVVNRVTQDLAEARNLYAFLAVFAPEARFRADPAYSAARCAQPEDPNPEDPNFTGQVKAPIVDWCNFPARLRQAVREAANVRMIVGQQFMVKALGMAFSGNTTGGEQYVRLEVAQLRAAKNQFEQAERFLTAGLETAVGNGCLVTDFYTQTEWSLLSRAVDQQSVAQYAIGNRLSYLGVPSVTGVVNARTESKTTYQAGVADAFVKMVGLAALARADAANCPGVRPEGSAVADLALNMLDAQRQAADIAAGLNIFGFDTTFTPARAYKTSSAVSCDTATGDGLWEQACAAMKVAKDMQTRLEGLERDFDNSQLELRAAANEIRLTLDLKMDDVVGCNRTTIGNDEDFFDCVELQIRLGIACINLINNLEQGAFDGFNDCIADPRIFQDNDAFTALRELSAIYQEWRAIVKTMTNITERIREVEEADALVSSEILAAGRFQIASSLAELALNAVSCSDFDNKMEIFGKNGACATAAVAAGTAIAAAGGASTNAEVRVLNIETSKETKGLLLDQSELLIAGEAAKQAFLAKKSEVMGMYTALERDLGETQRQRAYFESSPANDPAFRIVRDSQRLELATAMLEASKLAYLAARRAEYEYVTRLSASNFRISDVYRARIPQDIESYLTRLVGVTSNLAGSTAAEATPITLRISVAKDILKYTDAYLIREGLAAPTATPAELEATRVTLFRQWVEENVVANTFEAPFDGKPVLRFSMETSLMSDGIFSSLVAQGYDRLWRLVVGGVGSPNVANTGVSINLLTTQPGDLRYRKVALSQGGLVHLRSQAGCTFNYKLMAPAALLGLDYAENQNPEIAPAFFSANVNNTVDPTTPGFRTSAFQGRAISSTAWRMELFAGSPEPNNGVPDLDPLQLTDIEIVISATYLSRQAGPPPSLGACTRIDF